MCDPLTITAVSISTLSTVLSTTLGVVSNIQQGKAAKAQYEYQAQVTQTNQKIAQNNAAMERQTGLEEARKQRVKTLQNIGSQQTALAANGVDISSGTALDIIEDTSMLGELDALTIQHNAEKNARNYDTQAFNFYNDSVLSRYAGANAYKSAKMNALSTGIKGIGSIAGSIAGAAAGGGFGSLGTTADTSSTSLGSGVLSQEINKQTGFNSLYGLSL